MNGKRGLFITFEGADGTGKSTQIAMTYKYLADKGYDVVLTREPGGTAISEDIREILLDSKNKEMFDETEALLYAAARAQHVKERIDPALISGKMVICDRFIDSSLVYQGYARGLGFEEVKMINDFAIGTTIPDITFLMELSSEIALKRREKASKLDRIESNGSRFMSDVETGYNKLVDKFPDRIMKVDASGIIEEVFDRIKTEIDKKI